MDVPEAYAYRCCGSSQGWLIMCGKTPALFMFNPITRSRIELPPLTTFPQALDFSPSITYNEYRYRYLDDEEDTHSLKYMERFWMEKFIMTGNPSLDNDFIVVALYGLFGSLGYCRKGDDKWTCAGEEGFYDWIYWKGLLYGITVGESLVQCNLNGPHPVIETILQRKIPGVGSNHNYLVVSSDGDLLLIIRFYILCNVQESKDMPTAEPGNADAGLLQNFLGDNEDDFEEEEEEEDGNDFCEYSDIGGYFKTQSFRVYKPDLQNQTWIRVRNIGEQALFIGMNECLSFKAQDFPGCRPNHIYFPNDQVASAWSIETDFGAMDLETGKVETFRGCSELTDLLRSAPIWITPSLH